MPDCPAAEKTGPAKYDGKFACLAATVHILHRPRRLLATPSRYRVRYVFIGDHLQHEQSLEMRFHLSADDDPRDDDARPPCRTASSPVAAGRSRADPL